MSRHEAIMAEIEAGRSDEEIAKAHKTDQICIQVYRRVQNGTISPGSDIGRGQLTTLGKALRHVSNPDIPITHAQAAKILERERRYKQKGGKKNAKQRKGDPAGQRGQGRPEKGDRERHAGGRHTAHGAAGDAGECASAGED